MNNVPMKDTTSGTAPGTSVKTSTAKKKGKITIGKMSEKSNDEHKAG